MIPAGGAIPWRHLSESTSTDSSIATIRQIRRRRCGLRYNGYVSKGIKLRLWQRCPGGSCFHEKKQLFPVVGRLGSREVPAPSWTLTIITSDFRQKADRFTHCIFVNDDYLIFTLHSLSAMSDCHPLPGSLILLPALDIWSQYLLLALAPEAVKRATSVCLHSHPGWSSPAGIANSDPLSRIIGFSSIHPPCLFLLIPCQCPSRSMAFLGDE